jgi:hypothetical protein
MQYQLQMQNKTYISKCFVLGTNIKVISSKFGEEKHRTDGPGPTGQGLGRLVKVNVGDNLH